MDRSRLSRFLSQPLSEIQLEEPVFVAPDVPVRDAVSAMQRGSVSCVLTMERGRLSGIFTERDVLTRCMGDGFDWQQPLAGVLTRDPGTTPSSATVAEAIATIQQHSYRTLPVIAGDRVTGLIRTGDLLIHIGEAFPEDVLNLPPRPHQVMETQEGG